MTPEECERQDDLRWAYDLVLLGCIKEEVLSGTIGHPGTHSFSIN